MPHTPAITWLLLGAVFVITISQLLPPTWQVAGLLCVNLCLIGATLRIAYQQKDYKLPLLLIALAFSFSGAYGFTSLLLEQTHEQEVELIAYANIFSTLFVFIYVSLLLLKLELLHQIGGIIVDASIVFLSILLIFVITNFPIVDAYLSSIDILSMLTLLQLLISMLLLFFMIAIYCFIQPVFGSKYILLSAVIIKNLEHIGEFYAYHQFLFSASNETLHYLSLLNYGLCLTSLTLFLYFFYGKPAFKDTDELRSNHIIKISPIALPSGVILLLSVPVGITLNTLAHDNLATSIPPEAVIYLLLCVNVVIFSRLFFLIFQARSNQMKLEKAATVDMLTGISNRRGIVSKCKALQSLSEEKAQYFCLLDIEAFKYINDLYGHPTGDKTLQIIATELSNHPAITLVSRLGGDEFVFLVQLKTSLEADIEALKADLSRWRVIDDKRIFVGVSIGATHFEDMDFNAAYKRADIALLQAKQTHTGIAFHYHDVHKLKNDQYILELLRNTLDKEALLLYYQPIYDVDLNLAQLEVLMRLEDTDGQILSPAQFLDVAKRHGKMAEITHLILEQISRSAASFPNVPIAINIPPEMLTTAKHCDLLTGQLLTMSQLKDRIYLEVTEDESVNNELLARAIGKLADKGFHFALDDFGAGSSSLSRLATIKVALVKLDIALLKAAAQGRVAPIESAIALAKRLNAKVTIEGVENEAELDLAISLQADYLQGYLLSRPLSFEQLGRTQFSLKQSNSQAKRLAS